MGSYQRHLPNAAENDPLNVRINSSLNGTLDELEPTVFENWSAPQVKEAIAGLQRADQKRIALDQNANLFLSQHPECPDTERNGQAFNRTLRAMFGDVAYTVEQFEHAYQVCCANSLLDSRRSRALSPGEAAQGCREGQQ